MQQKIVNRAETIRKLKALGYHWHILVTGICVIGLHQIKMKVRPFIQELKSTGMSFEEFLKEFYGTDYERMAQMSDSFRAVMRELWDMS